MMRVATLFKITLSLAIGIGAVSVPVTQAVQLRDGIVYFVQPPKLVDATTTYKDVNVWGATYYFTINVPENAGESLQKVTITQKEGAENIRYDLNDTRAFVGTRDAYGGLRLRSEGSNSSNSSSESSTPRRRSRRVESDSPPPQRTRRSSPPANSSGSSGSSSSQPSWRDRLRPSN